MKKILTTITFFIFALAIAQEIKNDLPYISFQDLSDFSESSKEVSRTMIYRSEKLAKIFGLNNKYFIDGGGQVLYGNVLVSEWVVLKSFSDYTYTNSKQRERLVLISKKENGKEVIKSAVKVFTTNDYAICQLDKKGHSFGIAIGKYHIKNNKEFFEIQHIFSIFDNKLKKEPLNKLIYDCPPPSDYSSSEEPDEYFYGVKGGKKYKRYWYDN